MDTEEVPIWAKFLLSLLATTIVILLVVYVLIGIGVGLTWPLWLITLA